MSLSSTAFTERVFIPGSLEWSQQERLRRIQRIQQQREQQRLQSVFLREIRHHAAAVAPRRSGPPLLNNNTQLASSGSIALKETTSAKVTAVAATSAQSSHRLRKSKSIAAKAPRTESSKDVEKTESEATTAAVSVKKSKKIRKSKSKISKTKVGSKSSTAIASTSLKNSSEDKPAGSKSSSLPDVASKTTLAVAMKKVSKAKVKRSSVKVKASYTKMTKASSAKMKASDTIVKPAESKTVSPAKVSFSGTKADAGHCVAGKDGGMFCPVTTPTSILKNRKKIDDLCKSTLLPSAASQERLARKGGTSKPDSVLDRGSNIDIPPFLQLNPPPQPNIGVCKAFPGTKEWDDYWTKFAKAMNKYNKDMTEYEQRAAEAFKEDLARYSEQTQKLTREKEIYKNLGSKGIEMGLIPPPPITSKELKGLQLFNGYIMKSKGIKGTASNLPGSPTGVRFEVDIRGVETENVLIQKDHNLLTISMDPEKFLRIGTPSGKLAGDIQIWPVIDGIIIIDAP